MRNGKVYSNGNLKSKSKSDWHASISRNRSNKDGIGKKHASKRVFNLALTLYVQENYKTKGHFMASALKILQEKIKGIYGENNDYSTDFLQTLIYTIAYEKLESFNEYIDFLEKRNIKNNNNNNGNISENSIYSSDGDSTSQCNELEEMSDVDAYDNNNNSNNCNDSKSKSKRYSKNGIGRERDKCRKQLIKNSVCKIVEDARNDVRLDIDQYGKQEIKCMESVLRQFCQEKKCCNSNSSGLMMTYHLAIDDYQSLAARCYHKFKRKRKEKAFGFDKKRSFSDIARKLSTIEIPQMYSMF